MGMDKTYLLNYVNGALQKPAGDQWIDVIDPSRNETFAYVARSQKEDIEHAISSARDAFEGWADLGATKRSATMMKIAALIDERSEILVAAESLDNGKPIKLARHVDIPRASANIRFFANAVLQFHGAQYPMDDGSINYTVHDPLGVVSCISPWNLPLYLFTWKIAPALAAGNTVVAKPSEVTPYTAYLFSQICIDAGLPPGVLNIVHGYGHEVGDTMTTHPDVKAISFTGSTMTGGIIAQNAAKHFKKISLEMGGKNPNIIFADCDYDEMLKTTLNSSFSNQGEICLCGSRILVEQSIYDRFISDFVGKTKKMKVGPPAEGDTRVGAIVSELHYNKILSYIALAKEEGGTIEVGGQVPKMPEPYHNGFFIEPTIITGLTHECRTNQEEIFGPVVTVQAFSSEEEALALANDSKYGLSATVWTENIHRAHRFSRKLESGIVWVNTWLKRDLRTPFGGVKQSGVGREGGMDALHFFTEVKNICIQIH